MAISKKYDIAVKVGSYVDSTGQKKNRYQNIGAVMQGDSGPFILLDPLINLAAVPREEGKDRVMCSLFEPRDEKGQRPQQGKPSVADDDIPF
jgi:hypothetical protein